MIRKFYDTCALLNNYKAILKKGELCYFSIVTLRELENIKTSSHKDEEVKFLARHLVKAIAMNEDIFIPVSSELDFSNMTNDDQIIATFLEWREDEDIFITEDYCCYCLAKAQGANTKFIIDEEREKDYKGYIEINCNDEEELSQLYENINSDNIKILEHEYLIIKLRGNVVDTFIFEEQKLKRVRYQSLTSSTLDGTVKPKDVYQQIAIDALNRNQMSMLRGKPGSGKSYLALNYLYQEIEKGRLNKIIIFCNTVATKGAAKLGFYPGSREEKLIDSQIGNFLSAKFGDKEGLLQQMEQGHIELIPLSDIRGYDTTGLNAGIYITEAQNLDINLLKTALQRVGEDCKVILDGDDEAQVDMSLYEGSNNGIRRASQVFRGHSFYGEVTLQNIYRSKIAKLAQDM